MTKSELQTLYEFNDWANDRLCQMLYSAFGDETVLADLSDRRASAIQEATLHIISAQAIWRHRWQQKENVPEFPLAEYPTPLSLRMAFGAERARFWGFFQTLEGGDESLQNVCHYNNLSGHPYSNPLWQLMQHVITHGMYHRGQVTAWLLDMGLDSHIVMTDLIVYYREIESPES